jgi:stage V sporulation protein S
MSESKDDQILRVSASGNPQALASAIAHAIYETKEVKLRAIGAGSVNQAVKAIAIARGYTAPRGIDLACVPGFESVESNGDTISAIVLKVFVVN